MIFYCLRKRNFFFDLPLGVRQKFFFEVDEEKFLLTPCESRIQPLYKLFVQHLVCQVTAVDIYVLPLSSLSLVAGNGVGKLYLYGIQILVLPHSQIALAFVGDVFIIFLYFFE